MTRPEYHNHAFNAYWGREIELGNIAKNNRNHAKELTANHRVFGR